MSRRRKNVFFDFIAKIMTIILILLVCFLIYKHFEVENNKKNESDINVNTNTNSSTDNKNDSKENNKDNNNKKETETKKEESPKEITNDPSNDEKTENKNENTRKGGKITIELIGSDEVRIKKGTKYVDQGVKATYDDGSNAIDDIEIDNTVDTSKSGTYTVSYYAGNSAVIRRVIVE